MENKNDDIPFNLKYPLVLLNACQKGDIRLINTLLKNHYCFINHNSYKLKLDIFNIRDAHGAGVFHYAARGDQISVLKYFWPFLKNKTIPKTYFYSTPAHDASVFGSLKSLQWLIKYDEYQLLAKDIDGCNVLHLSAR